MSNYVTVSNKARLSRPKSAAGEGQRRQQYAAYAGKTRSAPVRFQGWVDRRLDSPATHGHGAYLTGESGIVTSTPTTCNVCLSLDRAKLFGEQRNKTSFRAFCK
jgi:hypothetical protein